MPKPRRQFVDGPFGQVHVRVSETEGSGNEIPLICLHQSPRSSREFEKFMGLASKSRTVIAIDNPGHGESDLPPSKSDATITTYAHSAWGVIDALGLKKVDLLGHHTGSSVAVEMAFQRPADVSKIVMISAPVLTPQEQAEYEEFFQPIPLDEAGTRFSGLWEKALKFKGKDVSLVDLAYGYAENFRAGDAYEWGHLAAFAYNDKFIERIALLDHHITVLNPKDLMYEITQRVAPLLNNGEIIDCHEWEFGFLDVNTAEAVEAVLKALD